MRRWWPVPFAFLIILGAGIAHGLCSNRWASAEGLLGAADRLAQLPAVINDWEGTDLANEDFEKFRADIPGFLQRRYVQRGTGREVMVVILCGRPGPVSVHTPEVCYPGGGYRMTTDRALQRIALAEGEPAPFWKATFLKESLGSREELRVYWTWNAAGSWQAVREPRLAFARFSVLHKLYVIYRVPLIQRGDTSDPVPDFLRGLVPEINRQLFTVS